jgi:hypothetical protein
MVQLRVDDRLAHVECYVDSGNGLDQGAYTGLVQVNDSYELLHIGLQVGRVLG